jgi:hypothetical protein
MAVDMPTPSPRGKWEKALVSSQFWLFFVALFVSGVVRDMMGFWPSMAVTAAILAAGMLYLRRRAIPERNRRLAQDAERGVIECAIRYARAIPGSLSDRWAPGIAEVNDGTINFQTVMDGTSQPAGSPKVFTDLHPLGLRTLQGKRPPEVGRAYKLVGIATDQGEIELAATSESLRVLVDRLRRNSG